MREKAVWQYGIRTLWNIFETFVRMKFLLGIGKETRTFAIEEWIRDLQLKNGLGGV